MTKENNSAVFLPVRCLTFLALATFATGCLTNQVKDFTPKSAMVCDQVHITGTFHKVDHLDGVWFNGVRANASFQNFPASDGPLEILAIVPEGASNGPIRVKISTEKGSILRVKGLDYTFGGAFSAAGSPPVPAINSFTANPAIIKAGQTSTLQWQVAPAVTQVMLDGADVTGTTSKTVSPSTTTFYELVAKNLSCLQRSQTLAVTVVPLPKIKSLGNPVYHHGDTLTVNGEGLARSDGASQVVFSQGTTTVASTVSDPSAKQLKVSVPATLVGGPVNVQVLVGTDASNTNTFTLDARKNGAFIEIKSKIGLAGQTSGSKQLQISTNAAGSSQPDLALFQQGGVVLARHNFQPGIIGGAAFSPGGDQAISVTADPNGFSASYVDVIERFATHYRFQFPVNIMAGFTTVAGRWHVLFSPDDTLVMVSSVPAGGSRQIAIQVHDLVRQKNIGSLIQTNCTAGDLQGEVIDGNSVKVKLDGAVIATFPIN